jgi:iron complex outermembrane receptor protein
MKMGDPGSIFSIRDFFWSGPCQPPENQKGGSVKKKNLAAIIAGAWFLTAPAAAVAGGQQPVTMDEVVVTATRQREPINEVASPVVVIDRGDIEQSATKNVPDLLQQAAGVHVFDITGNQRSYRVDVRGFGETSLLNTVVLVDGRRINSPDLAGTDWRLIPLERIERIEIIPGGRGSVFYGDNATGGTINIITRKGDLFTTEARAAAGSYRTFTGDASAGGTSKNLSYFVTANYFGTEGYRDNAGSEAKDAGLNLDYLLGDTGRLYLNAGYHIDSSGLPGALTKSDFAAGAERTDTEHPLDNSDTEDSYVQGGPEFYFFTDSQAKLDLSFRKRTVGTYSTGSWGFFEADTKIDTVSVSPQVVLNEPIFSLKNTATAGVDFSNAKEIISNRAVFFGFPSTGNFDLEKRNTGFYLHDRLHLLDSLSVSAGYRQDRVEYTFQPSTPDTAVFDETALTAGVNYAYTKKSNVYVSYSQGFRYPVIDELYSFFTNTISATLAPQSSDNIEVGVRHHFSEGFSAKLNFFRIETEDEIYYNPVAFANQNLDGKTRRDGVEFALEKDLGFVALNLSYTHIKPEIISGQFEGNTIPMVPENRLAATAGFPLSESWRLTLNGTYVGEKYFESDFGNQFDKLPDYLVFNSRVEYRWKQWTAYLDLKNLTNEEYSEFGVLSAPPTVEEAFYPAPKFNFMVGLRYRY